MLSLLYSTLILAALFAPSGADAKSLVQHKLQCMEESDCHRDASTKTVSCDFTIRNETRAYNGWPRTHLLGLHKFIFLYVSLKLVFATLQ
jgi:hypothetical protein